jgi:hypothetical protein
VSTQTIDRPMEQKRLEASAVVASRVSRLHLAGIERRITKREVLIVIGFSVALLLLVLWFRAQHDDDQQALRDQRAADRETIRTFDGQFREQLKESKQQLALIDELRRKLMKLGVSVKSIPSLPVSAPLAGVGGASTSVRTGSGNVTAGGRATPGPSRPVVSNPSSSSSAGRPNPTPTPTRDTPTPAPTPTHAPLIDVPSIKVGVIHLPSIKVG